MPGRSVSWRRDPAILARAEQAFALHCQGRSYRQIAAALGIGLAVAFEDVERARTLARERATDDVDELRRQQLERLRELERQAWEAFHAARDSSLNRSAYLSVIRQTEADIAKLLGLNAPERREISGPGGAPLALDVAALQQQVEVELERVSLRLLGPVLEGE